VEAAGVARKLGYEPRLALLAFSTFGHPPGERSARVQEAVRILDRRRVDFEYDGEMAADVALNPDLMAAYPFCRLSGPANVLVMPAFQGMWPRWRQALSLAIDRWAGSENLSKISILKPVGGFMRPGFDMALPEAELVKLPGFAKNIEASRAKARQLLKEAGVENLTFKLFNRNVAEPYTPGGVYAIDQWRRIGVNVQHEQLETKLYQDGVLAGNFDVAIEFINDFTDDPTAQFSKLLTKTASPTGFSGHEDVKLDQMYEQQRRAVDPKERKRLVQEMDKYAITTAYSVPYLWYHRIIVKHKKIKGWHFSPSQYILQDLSEVWLDQ